MNFFSQTPSQLFFSFFKSRIFAYSFGIFFVIFTNAFQVIASRSVGWIIDLLNHKKIPSVFETANLLQSFELLFLTLVGSWLLITLGRVGWRLTLARQTMLAGGILKQSVWTHAKYFHNNDLNTNFNRGHLMNIANSDVNYGRMLFGFTILGLIDAIFLTLITLIAMAIINLKFTLICLLCLSVIPFLVRSISKKDFILYENAQEKLSEFNDLCAQVVSTIRLQRLSQTGKYWKKRLYQSANEFKEKKLIAVYNTTKYMPYIGSGNIIIYILLFSLGSYQVINNQISIGDFVALQGLAYLLQDPLSEIGWVISEFQKGRMSLSRLIKLYQNPKIPYVQNDSTVDMSTNVIFEINNLKFNYEMNTPVLKNITLKVNKSDRIGITGPIGSGKTSLLNIMSGLNKDFSGEVKFLNKDIQNFPNDIIRNEIVYVHQKSFLFADTIKNNICLGEDYNEEELWNILKLTSLDEDVMNFPDKLDTELGEWGINLSGGQKQRLSLARALIRKPNILLLDDCLSAVDTVTEDKILKRLNEFLTDSTVIWVAHRESTLKYCTKIYNLIEGELNG